MKREVTGSGPTSSGTSRGAEHSKCTWQVSTGSSPLNSCAKQCMPSAAPVSQGLTLVHFSAQLERFVWDEGCALKGCSPC